jgi:transposase
MTSLCVAGIDVSKARLDLFVLPQRVGLVVSNVAADIAVLTRRLKRLKVNRVALEASGGLEYPVARALADAGLEVARVQPGRVRGFRTFLGRRAKTDALDAELIARFALAMPSDDIRAVPSRQAEAIRSLAARRRQIVDLAMQEKTRLRMTRDAFLIESLRSTISYLDKERKRIEAALTEALEADEQTKRKYALLCSVPGIGNAVATTLLTDLPELGTLNRHQTASLAGLAPHPEQSGTSKASAHIRGGRACVRTALYMAAVSAIRCNPPFKAFYRRLRDSGKPPKIAIVAVARKLVILANAILRTNQPWNPERGLD